jgi:type I restriction enzyme R subunit
MSKTSLTESEVCDRFITPAILGAGWDQHSQVRREYSFTAGAVSVRGKLATRGKRKRADYLIFHGTNLPIAVVEAKDNQAPVGGGMQQALAYAEALDVPFVFTSNGDGFVFHDRTGRSDPVERVLTLAEFPTPDDLWARYRAWKGYTAATERVARQPYHDDGSGKEPRYYQRIAIQRVIEAVAQGQRRVLVTMATGTGKTYTAFQIIWRLRSAGLARRVLFLADRDILLTQTANNDFSPLRGVMQRVQNHTIDKSYEVYLALYQAITGTEEAQKVYKQLSPDFFDLVIIDECHRGSAREDSAWREILEWFSPAVHLGLTATPKETSEVSTLDYFGEPVYTYSLRQGIADGFLAPYKVVRVDIDRDLQGWRPPAGMRDDKGQEIEDRIYNQRDMDRALVLRRRTEVVAQKVCEYMLRTDPYGKTIVFCEDIDHASRMRSALINEVARHWPKEKDKLSRFVVQITGDNDEGKAQIENFANVEKRYPVIATTSKLLSTGVDIKTCKLIVLDQRIESMIEFKQIIGRGTRIQEDAGKLWFTIMDFKKATELFADPDFDGDPVVIYEPAHDDPVAPPEPDDDGTDPPEDDPSRAERYVVSGVDARVLTVREQHLTADGRLITESLIDYTRDEVRRRFVRLDDFLSHWREAERKQAILDELTQQGLLLDELRVQLGRDLDPFDLICHVAFDQPPLTRRERAEGVRKRTVYARYQGKAREVLDALLDKYAQEGVLPEDAAVLRTSPLSAMGTVVELMWLFGGRDGYREAVKDIEAALYSVGAA